MNNNNDDKIREIINTDDIPEEISPESMKKMLDEKTAGKRRSRISVTGRVTAAACACAVLAGTAVGTTKYMNTKNAPGTSDGGVSSETDHTVTKKTEIIQADAPYMNSAESYEQIYDLIKDVQEQLEAARKETGVTGGLLQDGRGDVMLYNSMAVDDAVEDDGIYFESAQEADGGYKFTAVPEAFPTSGIGGVDESGDDPIYGEIVLDPTEEATDEPTEESTEEQTEAYTEEDTQEPTEESTEEATEETTEEENDPDDYSKTHNQEEGVLEADIVKTNGKHIYYVYNDYKESGGAFMNIAEVSRGKFTDTYTLDLTLEQEQKGDDWYGSTYVTDIYLYNDMLAVLGTADSSYWYDDEFFSECETFVSFYTLNSRPELIGTYHQEGVFNDVRITPEGYMYLITNDGSTYYTSIENVDDTDDYIPHCGVGELRCLPPQDILLPKELDNSSILSYTIIGSIDLTAPGEFSVADTKALAGYSGQIYCSADNLYTAAQTYRNNGDDKSYALYTTDITRIAVNGGSIVPQASGTVNGYINDQYSMSEYGGYFRVAVSCTMCRDSNENGIASHMILDRFNSVYVLDMDMNIVGGVEGFGKDETVKSVRFSGNSAYVVTYEQTDPLFAIDLSDPTNPFITDSFKILGYSTYMEKWDDGHLLGFGMDADKNGRETGLKLVMFDNSDPYNLKEVGIYRMNYDEYGYLWSEAVWDSKALLVAPEKNLIGVPVESANEMTSCYKFFSYDDGEFIYKGEITSDSDTEVWNTFNRAVYIGGYVYAVSGDQFSSADIETLTVTDTVYF